MLKNQKMGCHNHPMDSECLCMGWRGFIYQIQVAIYYTVYDWSNSSTYLKVYFLGRKIE